MGIANFDGDYDCPRRKVEKNHASKFNWQFQSRGKVFSNPEVKYKLIIQFSYFSFIKHKLPVLSRVIASKFAILILKIHNIKKEIPKKKTDFMKKYLKRISWPNISYSRQLCCAFLTLHVLTARAFNYQVHIVQNWTFKIDEEVISCQCLLIKF